MRLNPFIPGKVATPRLFVGRTEAIEDITQGLNSTSLGAAHHLLVIGERGIGKTSLMERVAELATAEKMNFIPVHVDLSEIDSSVGITRRVARRLRDELHDRKPTLKSVQAIWEFLTRWEALGVKYDRSEAELDADALLNTLLDKLVELERSGLYHGVLLLIDEADAPAASAGLGTWCKTVSERLSRARAKRFMLILAGREELSALLYQSHKSAPRLFQKVVLGVLSDDQMDEVVAHGLELANERNEEAVKIDSDAMAEIRQLSEGYPYFVQQYAFSSFRANSDTVISLDDVKEGLFGPRGAVAEIGGNFFLESFRSGASTEEYQQVLRYVADQDGWTVRKDIITNTGLPEKTVGNALASLKKAELVESGSRRGFYRVPTVALRLWLQSREASTSFD